AAGGRARCTQSAAAAVNLLLSLLGVVVPVRLPQARAAGTGARAAKAAKATPGWRGGTRGPGAMPAVPKPPYKPSDGAIRIRVLLSVHLSPSGRHRHVPGNADSGTARFYPQAICRRV
ncbi:hypothetical protein IWW55_005568, partial [Coemansia sp. RSA 2706]